MKYRRTSLDVGLKKNKMVRCREATMDVITQIRNIEEAWKNAGHMMDAGIRYFAPQKRKGKASIVWRLRTSSRNPIFVCNRVRVRGVEGRADPSTCLSRPLSLIT
jgi:hypothetical protein